ncbi:MAG: hypothetical protein COZ86_04190 [Candidatus Moranbacteria bacterium CG_4_8_14_3_um_filter_41_13]|nr:MAG: hypothetical protein COZ86_04190 [Candidatus Moranbacteria bacterium CG_4_8_14_3_um_filter_41_13]
MYWIYLLIFIITVFVPQIIREGNAFFREEDVESLIILCFGVFAFVLYLAKEKELLKVFREKLHLQRKTNDITKDLSDSYSYIGGMNRKFDIVKNLIFHLPEVQSQITSKNHISIYDPILQAVKVLAKEEAVALRFVDVKKKVIVKSVDVPTKEYFSRFSGEVLLRSKKIFWEEDEFALVRSPRKAKNISAFLIFPKVTNQLEDVEMFKILASQSLLLFELDIQKQSLEEK